MAKKLLILSSACLVIGLAFVTGLINVQNTVALYAVLPLGAVFFGLFLMFRSFEKEVSLYDEEQQSHPATVAEKNCECACPSHPPGKLATH